MPRRNQIGNLSRWSDARAAEGKRRSLRTKCATELLPAAATTPKGAHGARKAYGVGAHVAVLPLLNHPGTLLSRNNPGAGPSAHEAAFLCRQHARSLRTRGIVVCMGTIGGVNKTPSIRKRQQGGNRLKID